MSTNFELRLIRGPSPDGELLLADLAPISKALQDLATRVGRAVAERSGPGRTATVIQEITQLRLRGLDEGSTRLLLAQGSPEALDLHSGDIGVIEDEFWRVIECIAQDRRPVGIADPVADSAAELVVALQNSAAEVELSSERRSTIRFTTQDVHRETWAPPPLDNGPIRTMHGILQKVDLDSHDFRIRDDAGHRIALKDVADVDAAGRLIGQRVEATGHLTLDRKGAPSGMTGVHLVAAQALGSDFALPEHERLEDILASAPGPTPFDGIPLSDDEWDDFLTAIDS